MYTADNICKMTEFLIMIIIIIIIKFLRNAELHTKYKALCD